MNVIGIIIIICWTFHSLALTAVQFSARHSGHEYDPIGSYITIDSKIERRVRREIIQTKDHAVCNSKINEDAKKKIGRHTFPLKDDKNHDLSLVWLGDDTEVQILMTTTSFFHLFHDTNPTKLYKSTNGGQSFEPLDGKKLGKNAISAASGINKSPIDNKRMILVAYEHTQIFQLFASFFQKNASSTIIVTEDAGATFEAIKLPFKIRDKESFRFHPTRKDWILALESMVAIRSLLGPSTKKGTVWLSKDFGKNWTKLFPGEIVQDVKWGTMPGKEDHIFLLTKELGSLFSLSGFTVTAQSDLYRSTDQGATFKKIVKSCRSFGVQGEFVFATVAFKEKESTVEKRVVHISHDSGDKFYPIHLPSVDSDQFYAILEMHKGMIFMHLDESGDTGKGTLYLSGPEGRMYTKSLENHLYTNNGYSDFYKVESMEGVYLTQQLTAEKNLKSVITRDRGQTWEPINVNRDLYCKGKDVCSLHFHHIFTKTQGNAISAFVQSPISNANAPGIILLHGQAGDALTGVMNIWMSRNGGYNWTEVAKGPHHYAIGDAGNLIVLVPRFNSSGTMLKYSIDQGRCWHEYQFTDTSEPMYIEGLVTEPHSSKRSFSLWGYSKSKSAKDRVWTVVTVDFHNMFNKKCDSGDFDSWYPHTANGKGGCFLGVKKTYKRPKEDSVCYLGKDFNPIVSSTKCTCTKDDLQCDYGYERQKDGSCKRNKKYTLMICDKGFEEKESFSKGYRLISGDECEENNAIEDKVKYIKTTKECKEDEIVGIVNEEALEKKRLQDAARARERQREEEKQEKRREQLKLDEEEEKKKKPNKKSHVLVVSFVLVILVAFIGVAWFGRRYWRLRNRSQFVMSKLHDDVDNDEEGVDNDAFNPKPASQRPYKDESDWDDEELLAV